MTSMTSRVKSESDLKFQISTFYSFFFRLNKNAQLFNRAGKQSPRWPKRMVLLCAYESLNSRPTMLGDPGSWGWIVGGEFSTWAPWQPEVWPVMQVQSEKRCCELANGSTKSLILKGSLLRSSPVDFLLRKRLDFNDLLQFNPRTLIFELCARASKHPTVNPTIYDLCTHPRFEQAF